MTTTKTILLLLTIAASAIFTIVVNELVAVLAEPEEWQESDDDNLLQFSNNNSSNVAIDKPGYNNGASMTKTQNLTLPQNLSKLLELQVNFTNERFNLDTLRDHGFYIQLHVKSDRYSDTMKVPISDHLAEDNIILVPIRNDSTDRDDGSDFRIDVSINQFDDKFEKVNYPVSRNATFGSVNLDEMLEYVIEDEREEGNYNDDNDDEYGIEADGLHNNNNNNYANSIESSLIKDRPDNDKDDRPHAKIKDPKNND